MFGVLKRRVEEEIPQVVANPISEADFAFYEVGYPALTGRLQSRYDAATVRFSHPEVTALQDRELEELSNVMACVLDAAIHSQGETVVPGALYAARLLLEHERDHCKPVPTEIQREMCIEATVVRTVSGLDVAGGAILPPGVTLPDRINALSHSQPRILTWMDIDNAMYFALQTKDDEFIDLIEERLRVRDKFLPDWTIDSGRG